MARMKFLCDAERCIECNACVTACKNEHEVPWGINRRRVVTINDGQVGAEKSMSVACMHCSDAPCMAVCPVDCFREGPNMLAIDPDECIDCTLCVAECPVEAIYSEDELPAGQEQFLELNAELSREWPVITEMKDPPGDADEWRDVKDKLRYLER